MGTIFTDEETKHKFEVLNRGRTEGVTHFFEPGGNIIPIAPHYLENIDLVKLRLIRPRHTFGGVEFEEDENRLAKKGDYVLFCGQLIYSNEDDPGGAWSLILRPVAIEGSE